MHEALQLAEEAYDGFVKLHKGEVIYIATDDPNAGFEPFTKAGYKVFFLKDFLGKDYMKVSLF